MKTPDWLDSLQPALANLISISTGSSYSSLLASVGLRVCGSHDLADIRSIHRPAICAGKGGEGGGRGCLRFELRERDPDLDAEEDAGGNELDGSEGYEDGVQLGGLRGPFGHCCCCCCCCYRCCCCEVMIALFFFLFFFFFFWS